jgi:hypothetical protein
MAGRKVIMDSTIRDALQSRLETLLNSLAGEPYMVTSEDREEIKLLTSVLTLYQLDRLAWHFENGQLAILNVSA